MTPDQAKIVCSSMPTCAGFTFDGTCRDPQNCLEAIYFKSKWRFFPGRRRGERRYRSYRKMYAPARMRPPYWLWWSLLVLFPIAILFLYLSQELRKHPYDANEEKPWCCGLGACLQACCCCKRKDVVVE